VSTDTKADDLVTEEMVEAAVEAVADENGDFYIELWSELAVALRAVAPMIAARALKPRLGATAQELARHIGDYSLPGNDYESFLVGINALVAAEREACAKLAESHKEGWSHETQKDIAAAIRARGETP
jgi:hypothetical protein